MARSYSTEPQTSGEVVKDVAVGPVGRLLVSTALVFAGAGGETPVAGAQSVLTTPSAETPEGPFTFSFSPTSGAPGTAVRYEGSGCPPHSDPSRIEGQFHLVDSDNVGVLVSDEDGFDSRPDGTFSGEITIPSDAEAGDYPVSAICIRQEVRDGLFKVIVQETPSTSTSSTLPSTTSSTTTPSLQPPVGNKAPSSNENEGTTPKNPQGPAPTPSTVRLTGRKAKR